jgi:ABC-2 type transport system ATP-binding protein
VLVSSHLLAEIEQVCDSVSILARGRCVATGPVAEVLASRSTGDVRVRVPDLPAAAALLAEAGFAVSPTDDALLVHRVVAAGQITRLLAERGHYVEELRPVTADLETAFLAITGDPA